MKNFIYDKTNTIFHIEQSVCISIFTISYQLVTYFKRFRCTIFAYCGFY